MKKLNNLKLAVLWIVWLVELLLAPVHFVLCLIIFSINYGGDIKWALLSALYNTGWTCKLIVACLLDPVEAFKENLFELGYEVGKYCAYKSYRKVYGKNLEL